MSHQHTNHKSLWMVIIVCALSCVTPRMWASGGQFPAPVGPAFGLEDGTPVKLRLQRTLSSADARADDRVDFDVLEEVVVSGVVVIPKGSVAWGTITEAEPKKRMARGGKLNVNIDAVRLADGEKSPLRAVREIEGGGHTGAMTGGIVASWFVLWPAAPFFLFMHGKDVTIPKGTEVTAYINGDMRLDPRNFGLEATTEAPPVAANPTVTQELPKALEPAQQTHVRPLSAATPEPAIVVVKSTPDGADITVDGKFMGSTPSTLHLAPGDHRVVIEKSGFKAWQREATFTAGSSPTISATLEKEFGASPAAANTARPKDELPIAQVSPPEVPDLSGSYAGKVTNTTLGVSAPFAMDIREENGGIYGCTAVQKPLQGSGGFQGTVNGSRVVFEATGKKLHIRFVGESGGDALNGSYTVLSTQEQGEFQVRRVDSKAPPVGFNTAQCRRD